VLPLLKDVGWALIDYLKNGRPVTGSKKVFIRHQPPFVGTMDSTNMNRIFTKAIHVAGLSIPKGKPCGIHSLRHTLGRILLENEVSLPVIAGVLGHQTIKSTETYLKINIEKLFQCPLNPEEVFNE
jgi:site-specific recombinase XerD